MHLEDAKDDEKKERCEIDFFVGFHFARKSTALTHNRGAFFSVCGF
jgi:hypothetical protein